MNRKKYFNDSISQEERVDADIPAKQLGIQVIEKFEQEKLTGKNIDDVTQGTILREEKDSVNEFNSNLMETRNFSGHQVDIVANYDHNTLMAQFVSPDGDIADEIVSSPTPPEVTDRLEYYKGFKRMVYNDLYDTITSSSSGEENLSSSSEEKSPNPDEPSSSRKRKRDDDDYQGGSSKRVVPEHSPEESISSIYDLAGDD